MSCCGQKRAEASHMASQAAPRVPAAVPAAAAVAPAAPAASLNVADGVTLRLTHQTSIEVEGPVSGKRYRFNGRGAMQSIDKRDADSLLSTGFFARAWG